MRTFAAACAAIAIAPSAFSATLVVTSASDTPLPGALTLREAVANAQSGDVITFAVEGPILVERGEIQISRDLELRGPAGALIRIERPRYPEPSSRFRLFNITSGQVRFSNLALAFGASRGAAGEGTVDAGAGRGGAVLNAGELTLTSCLLRINSAGGGEGARGFVGSAGGNAEGGAIYNSGVLEVRNCFFFGNSVVGGSGGHSPTGGLAAGFGIGGALFNAGRATIFSSTFYSNTAFGGMGGSAYDPNPGGNGGNAEGGAVANVGELTIVNGTIYSNGCRAGHGGYESPPNGASGRGGDAIGGGLVVSLTSRGASSLRNTIIAGNRLFPGSLYNKQGSVAGVDVWGAVDSRGFNLIGKASDSTGWQATDQLETDPQFRSFAHDNGGPTTTIALRPGSPAIDAAGPSGLPTDQRGLRRTFDDPEVPNAEGSDGTDVGAFELQPSTPSSLVNLSARGRVLAADQPLIGGVIISGNTPRQVLFTGRGNFHYSPYLPGALYDAVLELHDSEGRLLAQNNDWQDSQLNEIRALGLYELHPLDAAILTTLNPGAYTVVVRGEGGRTGIALVEAYGISSAAESYLANLGVRADVGRGDNVVIDGFILAGGGGGNTRVYVRALGPSLIDRGVVPLVDPTVALHDENGNAIGFNNNWKDMQREEIEATGIPPSNDLESAMVAHLPPGGYTAVVRGNNETTGVAVVEVYNLDD